MSTIHTKGLYKVAQNFVEKGDDISNISFNNKVFKQYYQYLIDLDNKTNTIILKLMYIVFLERYLVSNNKTFKSFTKEDIINYINDCSKLNWSFSYQGNNFEGVLNGLLRFENIDIYVTGSNSKFLSSDIITEFRGRGEDIKIYPLSYSELMSVYNGDKLDGWIEYITFGGLPLVVSMKSDERKMTYLKEQQKNVYINDVVERNKIKNDLELVTLIEIISSSIGSLSNPKKLSDTFKTTAGINIDLKTVNLYLKYLEEAFILERVERYDVKGKKYMSTPYKFYFSDIGIRNSFINFRQPEETHIMENVIYLELKRRGYNVDVGVIETVDRQENDFIYKQLEVDFVANKGNNKIYIQSSFAMTNEEKEKQEKRSLLKINDSFKKIIIVKDYIKRTRDENGIILMSIFDFLLDIDSLDY